MSKSFALLLLSLPLLLASSAGAQSTYWVSKTGSDANGGTSAADSFLTIQRGVSVLSAGDTLNVRAGIYTDDGGASPYRPAGAFCGGADSDPSSSNVCIGSDGTPGNLITIQAAPGEEGQVTIDGQGDRIAINLGNSDYLRIRGFNLVNSRSRAINSWGQIQNAVADPNRLSIGVVIENNSIQNTVGAFGTNTNGIAMWGTKDWVVRNNYINGVREVNPNGTFNRMGTGIQSYGVINALVENNFIENVGAGIFWKDHFVTDLATRGSVFESEIRYNRIQVVTANAIPILISTRAGNSVEAGENYIRNNILSGQTDGNPGISVAMAGAFGQSAKIRIENNLIDGELSALGPPWADGISIDSSKDISITGNIITRTSGNITTVLSDPVKKAVLNEADYNIYPDVGFNMIMDRYSATDQRFGTLAAWQAALASGIVSLNVDNPDANSITSNPNSLFVDIANKDYRNAPNSPALGFMPDGSNAGPYQTGHEVIGLLPNWPMYTVVPEPTSAALSILVAISLLARRRRLRSLR